MESVSSISAERENFPSISKDAEAVPSTSKDVESFHRCYSIDYESTFTFSFQTIKPISQTERIRRSNRQKGKASIITSEKYKNQLEDTVQTIKRRKKNSVRNKCQK